MGACSARHIEDNCVPRLFGFKNNQFAKNVHFQKKKIAQQMNQETIKAPWAHGPMDPWAHGPMGPWVHMGPYGPIWAHMAHMDPYGSIWAYIFPYVQG